MDSTLVIKVKYGDTLRRFTARVDENNQLDLDMARLRSKILSLFNIPSDANFMLRYVDEDGDLVTLVDDDDLHDVMRQNLKFLRIDLLMNNDNVGKSNSVASGSSTTSTPLRSPRNLAGFHFKPPPDLIGLLSSLSLDFASKAASGGPVLANLADSISKLEQSMMNSDSQPLMAAGLGPSVNANNESAIPASRGPQPPSVNSTSEVNQQLHAENVTRGVAVLANLANSISKLGQSMMNSDSQPLMAAGLGPSVNANNESAIPASRGPQPPSVNSTSEVNQQLHAENVTRGVGSSVAPVDLNVLPSDSIPSQSTNVVNVQVSSAVPDGDSKKGKKVTNDGLNCKGGSPGASTSHAALNDVTIQGSCPGLPVLSPFAECPFSGTCFAEPPPVFENIRGHPFKRSHSHTEAMGGMFHKGVRCDGCGVYPITGPRYKSKVKQNYDLCSICFIEMGNGSDYIKMDRPASVRGPRCLKGLYEHPPWMGSPTFPQIYKNNIRNNILMKHGRPKLDSRFILDVNVIDGTMMAPSTAFTKIWRMRNNGTVGWPKGSQLVWIGGDKFSDFHSVNLEITEEGVPVDRELDIAVDFRAPESPGRYISYWRMASPSGQKFGQRVWVLIQVDAALKESFYDSSQGFNLNVPLDSSGSKGLENIDINVRPVVDDTFLQPSNSNASPKEGNQHQQVNEQPRQELGDNLFTDEPAFLATPVVTRVAPPSVPSVSYPIIDFSASAPVVASKPQSPDEGAPSSLVIEGGNDVEETLLKELEEMGFKQVDWNKEILRVNEYDLEKSVDDLCGVSDWDPLLEELQEMGFLDNEMNKRLLVKNNGSIKRVVLDLVNGEKA